MILIIDFGSQTTHLIGRRLMELGIKSSIVVPEEALKEIKKKKPSGIIFSGGPATVFADGAPTIDKRVFTLRLPILGICYGQQILSHLQDGKVKSGKIKEYGPARLFIKKSPLFRNIYKKSFQVWMSHGDEVVVLPKGFSYIAHSENIRSGAIANEKERMYGVQFHPEVAHTQFGMEMLKNFANICGETPKNEEIDVKAMVESIKEIVGEKKVIMAFSGGTDSFVSASLLAQAIGRRLIPVYIESGLMRPQALINVTNKFPKIFGFSPVVVHAESKFLLALSRVKDPERKRKTIGRLYVRLFEEEAKKHKNVAFLAQGTTYADFIHSKSTKHAALIKSHHNVGGLPKHMRHTLLEPIRYFYTDQVRHIGILLKLPRDVVYQQPFPGPGFAVRILGKVTKERLDMEKQADTIVVEEIEKAGLGNDIFQFFSVLTGAKSTAIKGDGRFYGEVVAIRAYTTKDRMTADFAKIPYDVLGKISTRIVNEVPGVSRVVYDITTKPPATMEWE